ncbi:MAG: hypothetical protein FXF47_09675 [Candidatus Mcinerneyibacterium aminivorans]|uniref:Uncharacterized protein n=1 Tax=Candidatus Mcinerneyibacterium aminivorans TaxID=2703815 RepID=A0A5D0MBK9_9BACT|nr:MAG: hypothetical protein FXF47_09675 [Candidatus Mcinerneyibacterium aminivorans]
MDKKNKQRLIKMLEKYETKTIHDGILVGFDGFIDNIINVVNKRYSTNNFSPIKSISDFAQKIKNASEKSTNIELVSNYKKIGGNAPIMANSLSKLNSPVYLIAALGENKIHSIFSNLSNRCIECCTISKPGETLALEFKDGKIMMGLLDSINHINWNSIINSVKTKKLIKILQNVKVISFLNWTMLIQMNDIIQQLTKTIRDYNIECKYLFFDLADFNKRSRDDIETFIHIIRNKLKSFRIILGLNLHEAEMLYKFINSTEKIESDINRLCFHIQKELNLYTVFVHTPKKVSLSYREKVRSFSTFYNENPNILTGAGDHFNAGFFSSFLRGFKMEESILMGIANSSLYILKGEAPKLSEIKSFINSKLLQNF